MATSRRSPVVTTLAALAFAAAAACSATNGGFSPEPLYTPPGDDDDDDGMRLPESDASDEAPRDAGKDASAKDADAAPPGPSPTDVRIQEIYVDHDGFGDGAEYVELRGAPGTPVASLALRIIDEDGVLEYQLAVGEAGDVIGPSGTWVVGGPQVFKVDPIERVDRTYSVAGWGLPNGRGAVQLVHGPARTLLDVVGWTNAPDAGAALPPQSDPKATSEGAPVVVPTTPKRAIGRRPAAADTNDNRADFCSQPASIGSSAQKDCD